MQTPSNEPPPYDTEAFDRLMDAYGRVRFWFDPVVIGTENVPEHGRAILTANHGQLAIDGGFLAEAIFRASGRRGRALSDRMFFRTPFVGDVFSAYGIVEGSRANALRLLEAEELLFAMPGGAREALVEEEDRYKLFWPEAAGFARMAIQSGAPIIPAASIGADDLYRQPISAEANQRSPLGWLVRSLFGETRYVPPLYAGLGPLPLPQQLWFLIGEPIHVDLDPSLADDDDAVAEVTSIARRALEALLARGLALRDEREQSLTSDPRTWLNRALKAVRAPVDVPGYRDPV